MNQVDVLFYCTPYFCYSSSNSSNIFQVEEDFCSIAFFFSFFDFFLII